MTRIYVPTVVTSDARRVIQKTVALSAGRIVAVTRSCGSKKPAYENFNRICNSLEFSLGINDSLLSQN